MYRCTTVIQTLVQPNLGSNVRSTTTMSDHWCSRLTTFMYKHIWGRPTHQPSSSNSTITLSHDSNLIFIYVKIIWATFLNYLTDSTVCLIYCSIGLLSSIYIWFNYTLNLMFLNWTRQKGLQIILLTNVINASWRLFVFVSSGSDKCSNRAKWSPPPPQLQCSLVNCLRWSAVKMLAHLKNNSIIVVKFIWLKQF